MASAAPLIQLATWNDWGEGTNIEPCEEFGYRDLEVLQRVRREHITPSFGPGPDELRLPRQLLELRQLKTHRPELLNSIAENIANGRLTLAMRQIEFLATRK